MMPTKMITPNTTIPTNIIVDQQVRDEKPGDERSGNLRGAGEMSFVGVHNKYFAFFLFPAIGAG